MYSGKLKLFTLFRIPVYAHWSVLLLLALSFVLGFGLTGLIIVLLSVTAHEFAHAFAGRKRGFYVESICMYVFGGLCMMNTDGRDTRKDRLLVYGAGPLMSLVLGVIFFFLGALTKVWLIKLIGILNFLIGIFNLLPTKPLDGSQILRDLLPYRFSPQKRERICDKVAALMSMAIMIVFLLLGSPVGIFIAGYILFHNMWKRKKPAEYEEEEEY